MRILLVNPLVKKAFKLLDYVDEMGKKALLRRTTVGPPLALNELAGTCPEEEIVILDEKTEYDNAYEEYDFIGRFVEEFEALKPDLVGFTCITAQYNATLDLLVKAKELNPEVVTMVGGIHPTLCPESFIGSKADIISIGMGKQSFREIVKVCKESGPKGDYSNIPGLALHHGKKLSYTKPLCELSYDEIKKNYLLDDIMPNRKLTEKYHYTLQPMNQTIEYISTSSGCTHKCNFCSIWQTTDGRYFHKDTEHIIRELKTMDGYDVIRFADANTFGDVERATRLFTRIIEEGLDCHAYMADVRTDMVLTHPDLMKLAVKAGLKIVICGLEATSNEELEAYDKKNTIETTEKALRLMNEMGILVNGNYIVKPSYVEKDFERVADFIMKNPIYHSGFTILTPFPGTDMWDEMKDDIVIHNLDYFNLLNAVLKTALPEEEFYRQLAKLYRISKFSTDKFLKIYHNGVLR